MLNEQTSTRTEIVAGITTFVTMAYILFVNPSILSSTGMDPNAVFLATCIGAGIVSILMGVIVKAPVALAPGMGLNAYFAVVAAPNGLMTWQTALAAVFISGIIFLILTVTGFRQALVDAVPDSIKHAITAGIGLFITLLGFKLSELIQLQAAPIPPTIDSLSTGAPVDLLSFEWNLHLANFSFLQGNSGLLAFIGLLITSILMVRRVTGSILLGIIITTLIGIPMGVTDLSGLQGGSWLPDFSNNNFFALDLKSVLGIGILEVIFVFTFVELFDTFGTMVATMDRAGILKQPDGRKRLSKAMMVDASGVSIGALLGTSTITAYVESASGVEAGGRRGLTAITVGVLFFLALFIAPVAGIVPSAATAPALIIVGVLMMQNVLKVNFTEMEEAIPAFLTIILMPLSQSIANGISAGILFYVILAPLRGKKVHPIMWILAVLVIVRYIFIGGE